MTGASYGIGIHAIAKDQYPRYRSPNGAEAFDKGRILGRYRSGMDQIKGTARAKLGQSCFQCKRVASPWSRTSGVVAARGRGFVSSYLVAKAKNRSPPCPNITTTRGYRAHRKTPPILLKLSAHYTGSRAQSANTERDASNHDVTMFGMSRCRQTLSKSISDHQISAKRHEF